MNNKTRAFTIVLVLLISFCLYTSTSVSALEDINNPQNETETNLESDSDNNETITDSNNTNENNSSNESLSISNINLKVMSLEKGIIHLDWDKVSDADYYKLYKYDSNGYDLTSIYIENSNTFYEFKNLELGKGYKFKVLAYKNIDNENILIANSSISDEIKPVNVIFNENDYRSLSSFTIKNLKKKSGNLRKLIDEPSSGYSIVQGSTTDGVYAYYLMINHSNNKGRILKTRISDNVVIKKSKVINVCHGNGMTYDSTRNILVVVGREKRRNEVTLINANNLTLIKHVNVNYSNEKEAIGWKVKKNNEYYGLAAIGYVKKYDVYVALQRNTHDLLVLNSYFKVIGFIKTKIGSNYPGLYQAMDMDEKYIYLLLSPYNSAQPNNIILALDWNSEHLLEVKNNPDKTFIKNSWKCNDDKSGKIDAVIKINNPNEAESLYHIPNSNGKNHFYLSEYKGESKYHWVTKKEPYKVKWKKVKKKVKWKKVKKKRIVKVWYITEYGELRYKYKIKKVKVWKYKKKKVWKYKTKYKKVKHYEYHYFKRDGYVYDLGSI